MSDSKPLILVTNDDGITAPGIRNLLEAVRPFGHCVVVAPDSPQSGMGHAVTLGKPLRLHRTDIFDDVEAWECSGTPVDCVKIAVDKVLHRKPDLCVSGINHGSNSSVNILYSGTMSAAVEACMEGIPSIGFSLCDYSHDHADFRASSQVVETVVRNMFHEGLPKSTLLNVNIPRVTPDDLKGIKVCRQAFAKWEEEFDERKDPNGRHYYWLTGSFQNLDKGEDTDEWALANGYASLVPVQYDLTAHHGIQYVNSKWNLE